MSEEKAKKEPVDRKKRAKIFDALREKGQSIKESAILAGFPPSTIKTRIYKIEKQREKRGLEELEKPLKQALKRTLKGKKVGDASVPDPSDIMRASEIVADRLYPLKQQLIVDTHVQIVDLTPYLPKLTDPQLSTGYPQLIHSTPETEQKQ